MTPIEAVFFDIGDTLVNEGEIYGRWADWLGVPRHTFLATMGAVLASGGSHLDLFTLFRPGFDLTTEERRRAVAGVPNGFGPADLYPDARECLAALRGQGLFVGAAGNQPAAAAEHFATLGLDVDVVGISDLWGVEKPDPRFFARCVAAAGCAPGAVLYVGDRIDNDVRPALACGLQVAHLRRGPWGYIMRDEEALARCLFRLDSLAELPALVARHNGLAAP
ncbi:MAG TPA: HAD family hydrolase [Streptosporangiaceae bacterium]|nr:HAD family hydrolase [Streptosporangiaceae bacterium]